MTRKAIPVITRVLAGVDWISATLGRDELDYQVWLGDNLYALGIIASRGNAVESRKLQGYEGQSSGASFVGENDRGGYVQYSSDDAEWAFDYVDHPKLHCSRIDVQITVQTDVMNINEGKRCLVSAKTYNKALPVFRQRKVSCWLGDDGADTVYIGSPSSDQRGRIYNKQAQSEDIRYTRCWRYEAVYRNDFSDRMFRKLVSSGDTRTEQSVSQVVEFFRQRGVNIRGLEYITAEALEAIIVTPTDVARKLKWLEHQVRPTLRKLEELGYLAEALSAIGR